MVKKQTLETLKLDLNIEFYKLQRDTRYIKRYNRKIENNRRFT